MKERGRVCERKTERERAREAEIDRERCKTERKRER